jgi:hypothetical protein
MCMMILCGLVARIRCGSDALRKGADPRPSEPRRRRSPAGVGERNVGDVVAF